MTAHATDAKTRAMLNSSSNRHGHHHQPVAKHYSDSKGYHSNRVVLDYARSRSAAESRNVVTSPKMVPTRRGDVGREKKEEEEECETVTWSFDTPITTPSNQNASPASPSSLSSSPSQENDRRASQDQGQVMKMPPSISISSPTSPGLPSAGGDNKVTQSDDDSSSTRNIYVRLPAGRKQRSRCYTVQRVSDAPPPTSSGGEEAATPSSQQSSAPPSPAAASRDVMAPLKLEIPGSDDPVLVDPRSPSAAGSDVRPMCYYWAEPVPSHGGRYSIASSSEGLADDDAPLPSPRPMNPGLNMRDSSESREDLLANRVRHLIKRIQSLKSKIAKFEEEYEKSAGYKPSHTYKLTQPDVKKWIQELNRAKRELQNATIMGDPSSEWDSQDSDSMQYHTWHASSSVRRRKVPVDDHQSLSDTEMDSGNNSASGSSLSDSRTWTLSSSPGSCSDVDQPLPSPSAAASPSYYGGDNSYMGDMMTRLTPVTHSRPLDIPAAGAAPGQGQGRSLTVDPTEPADLPQFMQPFSPPLRFQIPKTDLDGDSPKSVGGGASCSLLERRRAAAAARGRLFTKSASSLDIVPEGKVVTEFAPSSSETSSRSSSFSCVDHQQQQQLPGDAAVLSPTPTLHLGKGLHELTLPQMLRERQHLLSQKRRRRRDLKQLEMHCVQEGGRRLHADDRRLMDGEYMTYKEVKAKLKLLDVLIAKHDSASVTRWQFIA